MIFSNNIYNHIEHVGISVSPNAIRVVSTDKSGAIRHQSEITSPKPFIEGDVVDREILTKSLTDLMKQVGGNTPYAAVCFPEKLAYSREHVLPKLPIQEIAEAIRWQLSTIFPLNPADIYYDWRLIHQTDSETKVVVTAVSKILLDSILESCHQAGIKPISFESSAGALSRAIKTLPPEAIITEVDGFGSSSTLIENGVSSLTTTTSFATTAGSEAVLQDIVLSINHLLTRLQPKSDLKTTPETTPKTAPTTTPEAAPEPIPKVYITGEKSSPKLAEILSAQIGQKVAELNLGQIPAIYHIAYVESLTSVESPESEKTINLLPEKLQQTYRSEAELAHAKKTTLIGFAITAIACLVSIGVFASISIISQQSTAKLASIAAPPNAPAEVNLPLVMQKAQKITTLQQAKKVPLEALESVINITGELPLRQFVYNASTQAFSVALTGVDRATLFDIKDSFEASGKFNPVAIPLSALGSEGSEAITLNIQIKK